MLARDTIGETLRLDSSREPSRADYRRVRRAACIGPAVALRMECGKENCGSAKSIEATNAARTTTNWTRRINGTIWCSALTLTSYPMADAPLNLRLAQPLATFTCVIGRCSELHEYFLSGGKSGFAGRQRASLIHRECCVS